MILEVAVLDVKPGEEIAFEQDFAKASIYIASVAGFVSHELQRCVEKPNRYILLVRWKTLEAHTEGFRKSPQYADWKALLHHYYDPFPTVEHYSLVGEKGPQSAVTVNRNAAGSKVDGLSNAERDGIAS
jgi:heme-degrading monooxygenase HmoA